MVQAVQATASVRLTLPNRSSVPLSTDSDATDATLQPAATRAPTRSGFSGAAPWGVNEPGRQLLAAPPHYLSDGSGRDTYAFSTGRSTRFDFDASLRTAPPLPPTAGSAAAAKLGDYTSGRITLADPAIQAELKKERSRQAHMTARLTQPRALSPPPRAPARSGFATTELSSLSPRRMRFSYDPDRLETRLKATVYGAATYTKWGSDARSFHAPATRPASPQKRYLIT